MNGKTYEYNAVIEPADKGGAYVRFPYDIVKQRNGGFVVAFRKGDFTAEQIQWRIAKIHAQDVV